MPMIDQDATGTDSAYIIFDEYLSDRSRCHRSLGI